MIPLAVASVLTRAPVAESPAFALPVVFVLFVASFALLGAGLRGAPAALLAQVGGICVAASAVLWWWGRQVFLTAGFGGQSVVLPRTVAVMCLFAAAVLLHAAWVARRRGEG